MCDCAPTLNPRRHADQKKIRIMPLANQAGGGRRSASGPNSQRVAEREAARMISTRVGLATRCGLGQTALRPKDKPDGNRRQRVLVKIIGE